ncbi:hypothetical protein PFISCL1PPCAC_24368, partial [Pristionchus fissidentatus]
LSEMSHQRTTLRRVTLSGRFIQSESEEKEEPLAHTVFRSGLCMALDIGLLLFIGITFYYALQGYIIIPAERGFHCSDPAITRPWMPNTITNTHLLIVSLSFPFFIILACEAVLFFEATGKNRIAKFFSSSTFFYLEYLLVYLACTIALEIVKCWVGRLRPHFLDVCKVDWTQVDCKTDPNAYIDDIPCLQENKRRIRSSRTSFPSGHTCAAVFFLTWLVLYLKGITRASGSRLLYWMKVVLLTVFTTWTLVCAVTRVTDNWHHPTDVLGGLMLALAFVLPYFGRDHFKADSVYSLRDIAPPRVHFD